MFRKHLTATTTETEREKEAEREMKWKVVEARKCQTKRGRQQELVRECEQKNRTKIQTTQQAHKIE